MPRSTAALVTSLAALALAAPAGAQGPPPDPNCQGERAGHGAAGAFTQAVLATQEAGFSAFAPGGVAAYNQLVICAPRNR